MKLTFSKEHAYSYRLVIFRMGRSRLVRLIDPEFVDR